MAEFDGPPLISVRGEATIETEPEIAVLTIIVTARDRDRRKTVDHLAERNNDLLTMVKSYEEAVENLETSRLSVTPEMRDGRGERVKSYRGTVRTQLTINDFAVLGELTTRLSDQELITVEGPSWRMRRNSAVYSQARKEAAKAAVSRARDYAEALGTRLTGVASLSDTGLTIDRRAPSPFDASPFFPSAAAPSPAGAFGSAHAHAAEEPPSLDLEPGTQIIKATVEARFTIAQPDNLHG